MTKLIEVRLELLPTPRNPQIWPPCDYYLVPNLKQWLAGKRFYLNEEVNVETNAYFDELCDDYYKKGKDPSQIYWDKCIELEGNFVEE